MSTTDRLAPQERYAAILGNLGTLVAVLVALGVFQSLRARPRPRPSPIVVAPIEPVPAPTPLVVISPTPRIASPAPAPPPAPTLDLAAVAKAEAEVESARREKARAEARLAKVESEVTTVAAQASGRVLEARDLPNHLRDPSARIERAKARLKALEAEKAKISREVTALQKAPRPQGKPLIDKSPVARPANGEEFHFELLHGRVTVIDLERLLSQVKVDARIQLRRSEGRAASLNGHVGPIGAFGMTYQLGRTGDPFDVMGASFGLQSWEIIPERDLRGETYEVAVRPISDFSRSLNRLNRERATVTLWTYSDSFELYRKLRDHLHAKGYQVAARPMPEGMPVRGSLAGTVSAGQ